MIDIDFSDLLKAQAAIGDIDNRISDLRPLWQNFIAPAVVQDIAFIFETEGRGQWPELSSHYEAAKAITHPGKTILRRDDNYIQAATSSRHPGNLSRFTADEMEWGVDGGYFASAYGENYPERHELGLGLPERPVFELINADGRLDENISDLADKWQREQIAEIESRLR